jgi:hypothetical protein
LPNVYAFVLPSERGPMPRVAHAAPMGEMVEERWPIGLSVAFVISSSILLWLPIIIGVRWLLGYA